MQNRILSLLSLLLLVSAAPAVASESAINAVGAGGFDLVSYHTGEKPLRGNGNHLSVVNGVHYVFVSEDNRKAFEKSPSKYLPAYGGYCAYGVSVGKKFVADPDVWEIVDGQLYFNLDNKIKGIWVKDIPGNIQKANKKWPGIRDQDV